MLHTQPRPTDMQETVFIVDDDEAVRDSLQSGYDKIGTRFENGVDRVDGGANDVEDFSLPKPTCADRRLRTRRRRSRSTKR